MDRQWYTFVVFLFCPQSGMIVKFKIKENTNDSPFNEIHLPHRFF